MESATIPDYYCVHIVNAVSCLADRCISRASSRHRYIPPVAVVEITLIALIQVTEFGPALSILVQQSIKPVAWALGLPDQNQLA